MSMDKSVVPVMVPPSPAEALMPMTIVQRKGPKAVSSVSPRHSGVVIPISRMGMIVVPVSQNRTVMIPVMIPISQNRMVVVPISTVDHRSAMLSRKRSAGSALSAVIAIAALVTAGSIVGICSADSSREQVRDSVL